MSLTLRSAGPKVVQRFWRGGFGVLELCRWHVSSEQRKYGAGNLLGVYGRIAVYAVVDPLQECTAALGRPAPARMPALIVEAAE
jgi:hypothetical protein